MACQKLSRPAWATSGKIQFHKYITTKPKAVAISATTGKKKMNFLPLLNFLFLISCKFNN
jgi:hypothetical protein